jgi:hypothetical protein
VQFLRKMSFFMFYVQPILFSTKINAIVVSGLEAQNRIRGEINKFPSSYFIKTGVTKKI